MTLIIIIWFLIGFIGAAFTLWQIQDLTGNSLALCALMSGGGPIIVAVVFVVWLFTRKFWSKIVIKQKGTK